MKRRYFHGTTIANFRKMAKDDLSSKDDYTWNCSCDDYIYFWDLRKIFESEFDYEDVESAKKYCIDTALQSAQLTAAVSNVFENELVVIEFSIDENLIEDDDSCDNMGLASRVLFDEINISDIKNVYVCKNGYMPSMRLLYVCGVFDNDYFNDDKFSEIEIKMLKVLQKREFFIDELLEFEYDKINQWEQL